MSMFKVLLSKPGVGDLDTFAREFFGLIGTSRYEERESVHYAEDRYYKGEVNGVVFKAYLNDAAEHTDRPFCVSIELPMERKEPFDVEQLARSTLRPAGFEVAQIFNPLRVDERRVDY
jgi:hypothetical protein